MKHYHSEGAMISLDGVPTDKGYADGEFLNIEFAEDAVSTVVGTDGEVTASKSRNQSGDITLKLMNSSETNAIMSGFYQLRQLGGGGIGVFTFNFRDVNTGEKFFAAEAWIKKAPSISLDKTATAREWLMGFARGEYIHTGGV